MNNTRRKQIKRLVESIQEIRQRLEGIGDAERDAYDSLPDAIQESETGTRMSEMADTLEEQLGNLDDVVSELESCV